MSDHINYENKLVAFVDILGFKDMVLQNEDRAIEMISKLDNSIKHIVSCIKPDNHEWCSIKLFSDCFCISTKDEEDNLFNLFSELSFLQWMLASSDIFVNGAVTYGPHYESERIIFSKGLVLGYQLSYKDPYPRILIDKSIIDIVNSKTGRYKSDINKHIINSPDGIVFLDYIQGVREVGWSDEEEILEIHAKSIKNQIALHRDSPRILDKYSWLSKYHNYKFDQFINGEEYYDEYVEEVKGKTYIHPTEFPNFSSVEHALGLPIAVR